MPPKGWTKNPETGEYEPPKSQLEPTPVRDSEPRPTPPPPAHGSGDALEEGKRRYWIGCDMDGPHTCYHIAGVAFQHSTFRHGNVPGRSSAARQWQQGCIVELSADQVEEIQEKIHHEVIRGRVRRGTKGKLIHARKRSYRYRKGDYPVGVHLYMIPESEAGNTPNPPKLIDGDPDNFDLSLWNRPDPWPDPELTRDRERAKIHAEALIMAEREKSRATS